MNSLILPIEIDRIISGTEETRRSKKQYVSLHIGNLSELPDQIQFTVKCITSTYSDIMTTLKISDIFALSPNTRTKRDIPRPQNAFILFRKDLNKEFQEYLLFKEISKVASVKWRSISNKEKDFWKELSLIAKKIHSIKFPGYVYNPRNTPITNPFFSSHNTPITNPFFMPKDGVEYNVPNKAVLSVIKSNPHNTPITNPFFSPHNTPITNPFFSSHNTPITNPFFSPHNTPITNPFFSPHNTPITNPFFSPHNTPITNPFFSPHNIPNPSPFYDENYDWTNI
ncbi:hypothetical protein Glove_460g35 [Diversispora epigaea]|uniref:HMG box domain-containing protein n=1 Tax=Diversispora epigaea TaxID=1348612 RepID=A0A397GQI5_9GLOM|nr:hypothetical protein Glove_460g35 [Diversispora epigaea]